jgi:hypothetical protein
MLNSNLCYEKVPKTDLASLISLQNYLEFLFLGKLVLTHLNDIYLY